MRKPPIIVPLAEGLNMTLHHIPAGRFRMGQRGGEENEEPVTEVEVDEFWMGESPVSNDEYEALRRYFKDVLKKSEHQKNRERPKAIFIPRDGHKPIVNISFIEAKTFSECMTEFILRIHKNMIASIPCESRWEYACRANTTTEYWSGDGDACYEEVSDSVDYKYLMIHDVAQGLTRGYNIRFNGKRPNPWGLKWMHGGVWEMCNSKYQEQPNRIVINNTRVTQGQVYGNDSISEESLIVLKGGSVRYFDSKTASARKASNAGARDVNIGFRVCITIREEEEIEAHETKGSVQQSEAKLPPRCGDNVL